MGTMAGISVPHFFKLAFGQAQQAILRDEAYRKKFESAGDLPEFINGPAWGAIVQAMHDDTAKIVSELGLVVE